jgi:hypothetical protein
MTQQRFDDLADGVVGQAAVEGFDEVGGGEVADLAQTTSGEIRSESLARCWPYQSRF